ncbi:hypothetical protein J7E29_12350 [Streptomyces sp. ISL-90]|nr:hypothetical protein [Streptomyces sp. ISL-90]
MSDTNNTDTPETSDAAQPAALAAPDTAADPETPPTDAAPVADSPKARRVRRSTLVLTALLVLTLVGLGIAIATAANLSHALGATASEASDLSTQVTDLEQELASMTESRDQYRDNETKVAEREIAVSTLEDEVEAREAAVKAAEEHIVATTLKDGYAYTVGLTMEPGTYEANVTGGSCYWKITTSGTNYSDIVENDLGKAGVLRVTVGGGQDFQSNRCGEWRKVG